METALHKYFATRRSFVVAAALATLTLSPLAAQAKDAYPDHPIRLVVPFPPGGTTDTLGRLLAPRLAERLGQSVIVENRAGAATQIGAMEVARSPADGYTLLLTGPSTFTANPAVNTQTPYDPLKSFDYLGLTGTMPVILLAHPKTPYHDVKALVQQAKQEPSRMFYGSFGPGSIMHFAGETLNSVADIKMTSVAYKGSSPAMTDLIGGQIPMTFDTVVVAAPYVKSDKVRALAVTTAKRSTLLPDVPTMTEAGYPMDISSWLGIAAPAGLPADVRAKLERAIADTMQEPATRQAMLNIGIEPAPTGGAAFEQKVRDEYADFRKLALEKGIKPE
ncbi:Bug family tripartite tricarboxylate transporter substrate binding protein [Bordetella genomosp. 12]|uniref:ABC transporter substrate-binding protein n=1 Tax=Bordetella genomosp. 12 TaxID=463035 RepID=A0A261VDY3_9BORD|nr:tripartite tricarboxylate transporter substrate binding protein [Bordetella genomosp. 12]OZI72356.1 hypothetical protein CAL22_18660 [Bordetella genomosp. 12]